MNDRNRERLQQARQRMEPEQPPAVAAGTPRDPIERLLDDVRGDPELSGIFLTPNFLNDAGQVLERDGFGALETYLLARMERETAAQARFLLTRILPRLKACPPVVARRALGRYIIKILPELKGRGGP